MILPQKKQFKLLLTLLAVFLLAKLVVILFLPLTGDEAYLLNLGLSPRIAYYDHPQMHPWLVYLFSFISDSYYWFRIVGTLMVLGAGLAIYQTGKILGFKKENALLAAFVYILGSSNALSVVFINDVTIHIFLAWCIYFFLRFVTTSNNKDALWCGLFAGAAFLVKYLVAVVIVPVFIALIFYLRPQILRFTFWFAIGLLPFVLLNFYTNYTCCWSNIVFNVFNRSNGTNMSNLPSSILTLALVVNPVLIYFFYKGYQALHHSDDLKIPFRVLATILLLPFALLLLLSLKKPLYFAWIIDFGFIIYMLLYALPLKSLYKAGIISFSYSIIIFSILGYLGLNINKLNTVSRYQVAITPQAFCSEWKKQAPDYLRAATYYDESAPLSYHCGKVMNMFMDNYFGRDDDLAINYRALNGKNIAVLLMTDDKLIRRIPDRKIASYFAHAEIRPFKVGKFNYALLLGEKFNYQKYFREFIIPMHQKHYLDPLPAWFPRAKSCPMIQQ